MVPDRRTKGNSTQADRALPLNAGAERHRKRPRQHLPAQEHGSAGFARPARPSRAGKIRRHGAEPSMRHHGARDSRTLRLRQHGAGLHDAFAGAERASLPRRRQRRNREGAAPPQQGRVHRYRLLFRPGNRLAFLVSADVERRGSTGGLEGQQEILLDHVGRLRRLLRDANGVARFRRRFLKPVRLSPVCR